MLVPMVHAAAAGSIEVHGCCWGSCWNLWSKAKMGAVIYAAAVGHVDINGPCCLQRSYWCLWSLLSLATMWMSMMLPPESMWKSMIWAVTHWYRQESFFYSGIDDWRLKTESERHGRFLWQHLPPTHTHTPKKNESRREAIEESP